MKQEWKNKNYLLVGAARGVGKTLAGDLAEGGANLFLLDIDPKLESFCKTLSKKSKCKALVCDLARTEEAADSVLGMIGAKGLDGIVYFARGRQQYAYADLDEKKWRADFRLNVETATHIIHRLWINKKINKNAGIVLFSSVCSDFPGTESLSYNMSKSALESMCRYLAVEMGPNNIRVNTLQLGFIVKDEHKERFYSRGNAEYRSWAERVHPLRRVGHNEDVVGPIKFFLSKESSFITGQVLCVDGGLTIQEPSNLVWNFIQRKSKSHVGR